MIPVRDTLVPGGPFPVANNCNIRGGFKTVNDLSELHSIPEYLREINMVVFINTEEPKFFTLRDGLSNLCWVECSLFQHENKVEKTIEPVVTPNVEHKTHVTEVHQHIVKLEESDIPKVDVRSIFPVHQSKSYSYVTVSFRGSPGTVEILLDIDMDVVCSVSDIYSIDEEYIKPIDKCYKYHIPTKTMKVNTQDAISGVIILSFIKIK